MNCAYLHSTKILVPWLDSRCMYVEINFSKNESCRLKKKKKQVLANFIPRGGLALPDFPGLFKKSSFKMADSRSKNSNESILFRRNIDQYSLEESV